MKSIIKKGLLKYGHAIAALAFGFVTIAANSPCMLPYYEPEEPPGIEKYKKFRRVK